VGIFLGVLKVGRALEPSDFERFKKIFKKMLAEKM
jgi:hypothetical protein